jgi:electron transport complex protein RnfC
VQYYRAAKSALRIQAEKHLQAEHAKQRYEARQARLQCQEAARQARLREHTQALVANDGEADAKKALIAEAMQRVAAKKGQQF